MVNIWTYFKQFCRPRAVCALCHGPAPADLDLCPDCATTLPANHPACAGCAEPMPADGLVCGRCQATPPRHARIVVPWRYEGVMAHLVRQLKFHDHIASARLLGGLLGRHVMRQPDGALPDVLIPVPLHPARQRVRGFNQATEIARHVARVTGIPLHTGACRRVRATSSQATLDRQARRRNLRNAFVVTAPLPAHVAIIDDVVTTGSTSHELCSTLLRDGAKRVEVWAVARAARAR